MHCGPAHGSRHRWCNERRFRSGDTQVRPQTPVMWTPLEGAERHVRKDCGRPRDGRARERGGKVPWTEATAVPAAGAGQDGTGRPRRPRPGPGHSSRPRLKLRHKTLTRGRDHGRGREREGALRGGAGPRVQHTGSDKSLGPNSRAREEPGRSPTVNAARVLAPRVLQAG